MKKMKRILSLVLILIMCFSVVPMTDFGIEASAASNLKILGVDIGIAPNTHMQFSTENGSNSESGYYYNKKYLGASQCFGFARWCQYKLFGTISLGNYDDEYTEKSNKDFYHVSANGFSSVAAGKLTTSKLKALVKAAKPGAHLRTNKNSNNIAHSMIITNITDTGFSIAQCNGSYNNEYSNYKQNYVGTYTYTWSSYVSNTYGSRGIAYIEMPYDYPYDKTPVISSTKGESHSEIAIKWGKVDSATKYKVERRKSGTDDYVVAKSSTTETTFTDTGLEKGQRYFYKVTAYNGSTKLGTSEAVGVYTKFSPPTVTAASNSKLNVKWDSVSKAVDYTVMRRKSGEDAYAEVKTVTGTSFTDSGLSSSSLYYYWIQANCNVDGTDIIAKSTTGGQYTLTNAPQITSINDISKSEISLTWKAVSGASSYRIERRKSGTDTYTTIVNSTTNTSYTDSGLATGERYYYKVYAKNEGGESAASTSVGGYTKFNQPTVQTVNTTQLKLAWNAVSKAESYTIKRRAYNETSYKDIKTVTSTSYTDTGLNSGTKYYYWIQANCNIDGTSMVAKSTTGSNFTQITTPSVSVVSSSSLKLSWNAIKDNGTYKYNIQRKAPGESSYKTIATVNTCSYTDTGLKSSSTYYYKIQVVSSNNTVFLTSSEVSGKTSACTHTSTEVRNAKSATCTATGYTGDTYCKTCGTKTKTGTTIAKKSHNSNTTIPAVAATCTKTGLTEGKKCSVCGTVTVAQQTVAKKAHNSNTTIPAVAATCKATGLTEGKKCSVCGTVTVAQQTVAKKSHIDNNGDYKCDYGCGYAFEKPAPDTPTTPDEPAEKNCSCNCHKGGISGFFFKLINFFEKLFGKNKVCACGVKH